jgi:hypothetical protein
VKAIYDLSVSASSYWQEHYQFDKESPKKKKNADEVVYRFMINTLIPIQFAYAKSRGADVAEDLIQLLQ